jgi:p-hydroxybenzoate 3-monooxygenase
MGVRSAVAIVGAGPAGLLLSHLLSKEGIDSVILESRSREEIETTIRAGIVEHDTAQLLNATVASSRVLTEGQRHTGIELRFAGEGHRIDFHALIGREVWLTRSMRC